jgi:hypothetical protein
MGEAKRRHGSGVTWGLAPLPGDANGSALVKRTLASLAEMLNSVILLKEEADDLGDWPVGAIIGQTGTPFPIFHTDWRSHLM